MGVEGVAATMLSIRDCRKADVSHVQTVLLTVE